MHATDAARAGERVSQWMLYGPAQLTRGPHAGGVAGTLDAQGHAQYVYAEITGYFLQWLAWRARLDGATPELRARAEAAMRWLGRWVADARPATRVYLLDGPEDWRNRASFTFDLAMALRGSAAGIAAGLVDRHATLVSALCAALARHVTPEGDLAAYVSAGEQPLPSRWSTARGAFLAKAAAGILRAAEEVDVPPHLAAAADATFRVSLESLSATPHRELHPLCYAFEGVLALPAHEAYPRAVTVVAGHYRAVLADFARSGTLHEVRDDASTPQRVDVLAQCSRVGDLLARQGLVTAQDARDALVHRVMRAVRPDGSLPFSLEPAVHDRNVWAAMFVSQALQGVAAGAQDAPLIV